MPFSFQSFNTFILQMSQLRLSEVTQLPTVHSLKVIESHLEPGVNTHRAPMVSSLQVTGKNYLLIRMTWVCLTNTDS